MSLANVTIISRHTVAVVWTLTLAVLVDQIPHHRSVALGSTEDQALVVLVDLIEEEFYSIGFSSLNFDISVEVTFSVFFTFFDLTVFDHVTFSVGIVIYRSGNFLYLEWSQETILKKKNKNIKVIFSVLQR